MIEHQRCVVFLLSFVSSVVSATCLGKTPSVEDVLRICKENQAKLASLHIQATHTEERTEAYAQSVAQRIPELEKVLAALEQGVPQPDLERQLSVLGYTMAQFREVMQQQLDSARMLAKTYESIQQFEYFVDGENYQVRSPVDSRAENWNFADTPLTISSLSTHYAGTRIYSRSAHRSPPAQIWPGQSGATSDVYPMITAKHAGESHSTRFPAFLHGMHPQSDLTHPIDVFFSTPADRYRVVGEETKDGRLLTIVDVQVPTGVKGARTGPDGESEEFDQACWHRGWLDLERGGIPLVLQTWYGSEGKPFDEYYRSSPKGVTTTTRIERLASGGYYPAHTIEEQFNTNLAAAALSEAEWREVQSGTRPVPPQVCFERHAWDCTLVESHFKHTPDFFVLDFPPDSKLFDLDTGKVVGALELSPQIGVGQQMPEWEVTRWLDGQPRKLADFRGRVVVMLFWNRDSSACLAELAALAEAQQKISDQSLAVVAIHTAESDVTAAVDEIEKLASERDWHFLHAIDKGSMYENSHTRCAYGVEVTPARVVVGADGKVVANSSIPSTEIADIVGKPCDEVTPQEETRFADHMKRHYAEAGVSWSDNESQADRLERYRRVSVFYMTREIEAGLKGAR